MIFFVFNCFYTFCYDETFLKHYATFITIDSRICAFALLLNLVLTVICCKIFFATSCCNGTSSQNARKMAKISLIVIGIIALCGFIVCIDIYRGVEVVTFTALSALGFVVFFIVCIKDVFCEVPVYWQVVDRDTE